MPSFTTYTVAPDHAGLTVEEYLKTVLHFSGRSLQRLTRKKGIYLNGHKVYLQKKVKQGDSLRLLSEDTNPTELQPEPGSIDILYEDNHMLIVNKPPRQLVHPAGHTTRGTTANYLAYYLQQAGPVTIRPVHRLDRDTSGCVIFAKDAHSQHRLQQQLQAGIMRRQYQALVKGSVSPGSGTITAPIGAHPSLPNRRAVRDNGEPAITHYQTLCSAAEATLLELQLETGRTHQIRVHLAHMGYPLIGDAMYGSRSPWMARQALHASAVTFHRLQDNQPATVRAPLPDDFLRALSHFIP